MSESKAVLVERRAAARAEWERIIGAYEAGGQTGTVFCREHGLPIWQFRYWRKALRKPEADCGGFVELKPNRSVAGVWVESGRWRIQVCTDFDARVLRRVAEALS